MNLLRTSWKRWLTWFLLAVLFAVACGFLANWQFNRRAEAVSKIELVLKNYNQEPLPLAEVLDFDETEIRANQWRPVVLEGQYLPEGSVLVRSRPVAGTAGFLQLATFQTPDGESLIIERGWVPTGSKQTTPDVSFDISSAPRVLIGRIRLGEADTLRESPDGQIASIHLPTLSEISGESNLEQGFYLRLVSESPADKSYPQPLGKPTLDEGNHLSYAVQWILFAVMGFWALIWGIRQEQQYRRMETDKNYKPKKKIRKSDLDNEAEDQLVG
jgi:cytochrome oxidase assembly protein ShyY1